MSKLIVTVHPNDRDAYVSEQLQFDGLGKVVEDVGAAYCPISLTQTPDELKPIIGKRQEVLIGRVLKRAGIQGYNPASAPFSPDKGLSHLPQEIYLVDSGKIASSRFFVGHNVMASTGFGVEMEKAVRLNRVAVVLMDRKIRVSRMQPHRTIYLQYEDFEKQVDEFAAVFEMLKEYEPGMGFEGREPVLVGEKRGEKVVNLEKEVYSAFPGLKYVFDGSVSTLELQVKNVDAIGW